MKTNTHKTGTRQISKLLWPLDIHINNAKVKQETEFKYPVIIFSDNEQRQNQNVKEQTRGMSAITVTHTSDDYNGRFGGEGGRGRRGRGKIVNAKNCFYSKSFFFK